MRIMLAFVHGFYRLIRPFIFLFPSESVHQVATWKGKLFGKIPPLRSLFRAIFKHHSPVLRQNIFGIEFLSPLGLAAGFDYEAKLTQILPTLGFGFETIGTITNKPYEGNPKPRLGRLVKSRSLLVNKGFKNLGIEETLLRLQKSKFEMPIGISLGKTNSRETMTQEDAVRDICASFDAVQKSSVQFSYYELNISCPNLFGSVEFYSPTNLRSLLREIFAREISRPIFIKMPIDRTDEEAREMLKAIREFPISGVIFGNLQKDRMHPSLLPNEVANCGKGNFSGKPTEIRSNELISLAYREFAKESGGEFIIIGCGGVFSAEDAYRKIKLGASLVELITGLVFEGPQLVAQINLDLPRLLQKDGFKNISEAVGVESR